MRCVYLRCKMGKSYLISVSVPLNSTGICIGWFTGLSQTLPADAATIKFRVKISPEYGIIPLIWRGRIFRRPSPKWSLPQRYRKGGSPMAATGNTHILECLHRSTRRRIRRTIVQAMACLVVFCTTYALILPAITMETTWCGLEAHPHRRLPGEDHPRPASNPPLQRRHPGSTCPHR